MGCTSSSAADHNATSSKASESSAPKTTTSKATTKAPAAASASTARKAPPNTPHTFESHYVKGQVLGEGAYSQAVICTNKFDPTKKHACKITRKAGLQSADDIASIVGEIEILKKLNHPSIVGFIDNFEDADCYYVILELMQGGELFDRIVQKTQYNEGEARDIFIVIMRGLKFLHDNNIVHRDLKPENLLMLNDRDDTAVKIADFGFAKIANGLNLTTQCGSPGYVAPEILMRMKYGKPVDMWAMGVITYILLAGYAPFNDEGNQQKLFEKIKKAQYDFDPEYWGHITREAKDLIRGMLTLDPARRLTVDQALTHPWVGITAEQLRRINLDANLKELKKFNANRKFKAAAKAVIAINKMNSLIGKPKGSLTPNPVADK